MASGQWWVVQNTGTTPDTYTVVQAVTAPAGSRDIIPWPTRAAAQKEADALNKSARAGVAKTLESKVPGLTGLAAIGDFFSRLTQANTWLRLGEGLLGLILIAVGVARITRVVPLATQIASAVR